MSLCEGLNLYEVETDIFYSTLNEVDGKRLLLKYPEGHEKQEIVRKYFEEDGTGWWSEKFKGWIYPHCECDLKYLQKNGAVWKGIMHTETTTTPTDADYIGEYCCVLRNLVACCSAVSVLWHNDK
jgi:hypothetical protein